MINHVYNYHPIDSSRSLDSSWKKKKKKYNIDDFLDPITVIRRNPSESTNHRRKNAQAASKF